MTGWPRCGAGARPKTEGGQLARKIPDPTPAVVIKIYGVSATKDCAVEEGSSYAQSHDAGVSLLLMIRQFKDAVTAHFEASKDVTPAHIGSRI